MIVTDSTPVSTRIIVKYPIEVVKDAIDSLLKKYPQYFLVKKNGVNAALGTYLFDRPKGIDTPTIRLMLSSIDELNTAIEINCSSDTATTSSSNYQVAISEVQNILVAKLNGKTDDEMLAIIKDNNSGNGFIGCVKTFGCIAFIIIAILGTIGVVINSL